MLKIKDNVEFKNFKKYGFTLRYSVYDGSVDSLIQQWGYPYCDNVKEPFIKFKRKLRKNNILSLLSTREFYYIDFNIPNNPHNKEIFFDTLYDLIKDGLVEKVSDK